MFEHTGPNQTGHPDPGTSIEDPNQATLTLKLDPGPHSQLCQLIRYKSRPQLLELRPGLGFGQKSPYTSTHTSSCVQVAEEDEQVPGVDPREVQRSEARSDKEELRCVIAVIRHGGTHSTDGLFALLFMKGR